MSHGRSSSYDAQQPSSGDPVQSPYSISIYFRPQSRYSFYTWSPGDIDSPPPPAGAAAAGGARRPVALPSFGFASGPRAHLLGTEGRSYC